MKILVFTEGTILMHSAGKGRTRNERVKLVEKGEKSVKDYKNYIPIGNAVKKLNEWAKQADIYYLTSRRTSQEIADIQDVLSKHHFPKGVLLHRKEGQDYKDVAEELLPNILIEDDCESIGGTNEMTITHVNPDIKSRIKSVPVKEFGGIDHLPSNLVEL